MAEADQEKTPALAEQWSLQDKEEKSDPSDVSVKETTAEKPAVATSGYVVLEKTGEIPVADEKAPVSEAPDQEVTKVEETAEETPEIKIETAPADFRFPTTNQTRHCFTRYIEYHRCVAAKGEDAPECEKFAKYYRSLCPSEWFKTDGAVRGKRGKMAPSRRRQLEGNQGNGEVSARNEQNVSEPHPPPANGGSAAITADQANIILENLKSLSQLLAQAIPNVGGTQARNQEERREENPDNRQNRDRESSARESRRPRRRAIRESEEEEQRSRRTERTERTGRSENRGSRSRSRRPAYGDQEQPFDEYIMEEPLPAKFKLPEMELFDGTSDPRDHIFAYRAKMTIQRATDALLCRAFPATLKGPARDWFQSLRRGSITSFRRMTEKFEAHFVSSKRRTKHFTHLSTVKQRSGESLRDFVGRFNAEALQVRDLNQQTAINAFMLGLNKGRFRYSLFKDPAKSLSELLKRADGYIRAEEAEEGLSDAETQDKVERWNEQRANGTFPGPL